MPMSDQELVAKLQAENARLISLLDARGIEWRPPASVPPASEPSKLSTGDKVALFRHLFRGRTDIYPIRWESKTTGKSGYSPACANEWRPGVCERPRIKCGDCGNRMLIPLSDAVIYGHLAGEHTVGVYPLLEDDSCYFVAVDFDEAEWQSQPRSGGRVGIVPVLARRAARYAGQWKTQSRECKCSIRRSPCADGMLFRLACG